MIVWRRITAGWNGCWQAPKLQNCRIYFLEHVRDARRVLLLGEGHGRFLEVLRRAGPLETIICLDWSQRMLEQTRKRLRNAGLSELGIEFVHADARDWSPPAQAFDLIVANFFFDCFGPADLSRLARKLSHAAASGARLVVTDFRVPAKGILRWRALLIHRLMYVFFRLVTGIPAARLTPPEALLQDAGFRLIARKIHEAGLLHSDLWVFSRE